MSNLTNITGYRTNEDGTETLAYDVDANGFVSCVHEAPKCCAKCLKADERLFRNHRGDVIRHR